MEATLGNLNFTAICDNQHSLYITTFFEKFFSMKFVTLSFKDDDGSSLIRKIEAHDGWWVRFGNEILIYAADKKFDAVMNKLGPASSSASVGNIKKGDMHLVVQRGRVFQLENPDVPIILDKGRYLVADIAKPAAKKIARNSSSAFRIEPLAENTTVFETLQRIRTERAPEPQIASVVNSAQSSYFQSCLTQLVSYPTRFSTSSDYMAAANWASDELTAMGLTSTLDPINIPGLGASANVVARKTGTAPAGRKNIIIIAHLDSVNHPGGQNAPAPGADDNASGSAGLLTMAQALASTDFQNDLTFILAGGEEQGLHGSTQYLASLSDDEKSDIHAVLNMDMIGTVNSSPLSVLLEGLPLSQWIIDALSSAAASYSTLNIQISLSPFASDHMPFLDAAIPAVLTIEGTDGANDAIHTGNDTIDRIDIGFAMEILRMNIGFAAEQANISGQPSAGCICDSTNKVPTLTEHLQTLSGHYHGLQAQYSRLARDGKLLNSDYDGWQAIRITHNSLPTQLGLQQVTGH